MTNIRGSGRTTAFPDADDMLSVGAAGLLAYLSADVAHHGLGHPAGCLLMGGRVTRIAATVVECTDTGIVVDLAGPLANLLLGLAALVFARRAQTDIIRLLLLLAAAVNLFWLGGQVAYSAATATDDWNQLILVLGGSDAVRITLALIGVAIYLAMVRVFDHAFACFARPLGRLPRLLGIAYAAMVMTALLTALFDVTEKGALYRAAAQILLPSGLLFLRAPTVPTVAVFIDRNVAAISAAALGLLASIVLLGRGLSPLVVF